MSERPGATRTVAGLEAVRFPVHGMTCTSCVNRITRALRKVDGVSSVRVDLGREIATVTRIRGLAPGPAIAAAVAAAGYEAEIEAATVEPASGHRGLLARFLGR